MARAGWSKKIRYFTVYFASLEIIGSRYQRLVSEKGELKETETFGTDEFTRVARWEEDLVFSYPKVSSFGSTFDVGPSKGRVLVRVGRQNGPVLTRMSTTFSNRLK